METLSNLDTQFFLFLNGLHADWLDTVMIYITNMLIWLPLYLLLIYWVIKQYGKRSWWIFVALGVVVLCSDQISASIFKPLFHRLRPCYTPELEGLIHLPKGLAGGKLSFVSSHAANTFAIATFLTAAMRQNKKWIGWILFPWALISSYSRIYLGFHYPGDIICGAILGILIGWLIWKLFGGLEQRIESRKNSNVQ